MILPEARSEVGQSLAFKKYDTEELADAYFFRPLGSLIVRAALAAGSTPNQLTLLSGVVGTIAGLLLYDERFGLFAFALLILHGIIDSADGQLARQTGRMTESGFYLDGMADYLTETAICLGIAAGILHRGGSVSIMAWAILANLCIALQGINYVYYRIAYADVVAKGALATDERPAPRTGFIGWLRDAYLHLRQRLSAGQVKIARRLRERAIGDTVRDEDRVEYARQFYWPKRGWNLFGSNTRFYAIGVLAWMHRLDLYFAFILVPMNLALVAMWFWQRSVERRFLAHSISRTSS